MYLIINKRIINKLTIYFIYCYYFLLNKIHELLIKNNQEKIKTNTNFFKI